MSMQAADQDPRVQAMEDELERLASEKPISFWRLAVMRLRRDRLTMAAVLVLVLITFSAVFADFINSAILGFDPNASNLLNSFARPTLTPEEGAQFPHLLGTDGLGRDQLARILVGGRISLLIGFFGTVFTLLFGLSLGMIAAYFGRWVDDTIMFIINTLGAIPGIFLLLIIGSLWELTPLWLAFLFGILGWPGIARLVRSTVFSLREQEYVIAARALGSSSPAILLRHILPNVVPIVIIATARRVGGLILAESALSFLGFGVQPPTSTWGSMLTKAQQFLIIPEGQHLVLAPGIMITITVLCLYIIGDGLRDALDPRLR